MKVKFLERDDEKVLIDVAISAGGDSEWDNLAPACRSCNSSKHTKPLLEFLLAKGA